MVFTKEFILCGFYRIKGIFKASFGKLSIGEEIENMCISAKNGA